MPYKNKEDLKSHNKKYKLEHRKELASKKKEYELKSNSRYKQCIRNAKFRNVVFDLSLDQHKELIKTGLCHYCNQSLNKTGGGLDRKDNNTGYLFDNCVSCCGRCNTTFSDNFNYEEKLMLSKTIKEIDGMRKNII